MQHRFRLAVVLALSALGSVAGCVSVQKLAYRPDELRTEVHRRAPELDPADIVVPYELSPAHVELAHQLVHAVSAESGGVRARTFENERVRELAGALFDPRRLGLRYVPSVTTTAEETLRQSQGNCLALASVFIGLARAVGLEAYYIDASVQMHETRYADDGTTVNEGHVTAMVKTPTANIGLDFSAAGRVKWYRVLDDVEALAHFYNNRGFEQLDRAESAGEAVDWVAIERDFRRAVQVLPSFARAWNNLGLAASRLGHRDEAMRNYRTAIARDPRLAAPHNNLGSLHLAAGDLEAALTELEAAAKLDPAGSHIQYNLAMALLQRGDRNGARRALERAITLRADYPQAQAMLSELGPPPSGRGTP
jgi:regulator of sirC expression with transglutaminase-like and TPR domain